jgi:putative oxidoreductase
MKKPLPLCLWLLRIGMFIVMLVWAIDKFIRPGVEASVYHRAYHLPLLPAIVIYIIGAFQILLATTFVMGLQKTFTAGLMLLGVLIYTIASYRLYMPPFQGDNLLFFAAWPMLAVCFSLYLLRKQDTLLAFS